MPASNIDRTQYHLLTWHSGQTTYTEPAVVTTNAKRMWGNSTVIGTRIPVFRLVELVEDAGYTPERICTEIYPELRPDQVRAALKWYGVSEFSTAEETTDSTG